MKGLKGALLLAAVSVAALALSGCWSLSGFSLSKTTLAPGPAKKSVANVRVRSHVTANAREAFFIFTAVGDESGLNVSNKGKFDITRKFRNKPRPLQNNEAIRDEIVSDGNCGELQLSDYEPQVAEGEYKVLSTPGQFNNGGISNKQAVSKFRIRQATLSTHGGEPEDGGDLVSDVIIAVGRWRDTNDNGEVDAADAVQCGGLAVTEINTKFAE